MARILRVLARLSLAEQRDMVGVLAAAVLVEVLIRTRPLPRVARMLGVKFPSVVNNNHPADRFAPDAVEMRRLQYLRQVMRRWPFADGTCLRESLVAGHVLRRHRPALALGAVFEGDAFCAHAWLEVAGRKIGFQGPFARFDA